MGGVANRLLFSTAGEESTAADADGHAPKPAKTQRAKTAGVATSRASLKKVASAAGGMGAIPVVKVNKHR